MEHQDYLKEGIPQLFVTALGLCRINMNGGTQFVFPACGKMCIDRYAGPNDIKSGTIVDIDEITSCNEIITKSKDGYTVILNPGLDEISAFPSVSKGKTYLNMFSGTRVVNNTFLSPKARNRDARVKVIPCEDLVRADGEKVGILLRERVPAGDGFTEEYNLLVVHNEARVYLRHMDDLDGVPDNTFGVVKHIDDIGRIEVTWENGRHLALMPETDDFEVMNYLR